MYGYLVALLIVIVALVLVPSGQASEHVQVLGLIGRFAQNHDVRAKLRSALYPSDVVEAVAA